jgi:hypothetical protein
MKLSENYVNGMVIICVYRSLFWAAVANGKWMTVKKENGVMVLSTGYSDLSISTDYSVE